MALTMDLFDAFRKLSPMATVPSLTTANPLTVSNASSRKSFRGASTARGAVIQTRRWIRTENVASSPRNDSRLNGLGQLLKYARADVSKAASKTLGLRSCYLSEQLIGLALFHSPVEHETKKRSVREWIRQHVLPKEACNNSVLRCTLIDLIIIVCSFF